jgi:NAD(P)-dependent dehydrogenase (short-subunit alcohol dehydrogenase family)
MATDKKVVLITGASAGIGRAVAIAFLQAGHNVVLTGRRAEALEESIGIAGTGSATALAHACDITDPVAVKGLFAACKTRFGRLDVLFNNAGVNSPGGVMLEDLTFDQWKACVDTNLTGPFLCTQEAFRLMKSQTPQGGRIINNGSVSAYAPRPNSAPYAATKHAITGLTRSTSLDGRKYNIACGQIDIGNALTDMARKMTTGVPQADGSVRVEPVMDAKHVSDAVLHMASLPLEANVLFMTVMASAMPFVGRG